MGDGVYVIFILVEHHLSFFFIFYILEELYLMVHTFIIQILVSKKIPFFPFIFLKDFFGFILILCLYLLQTHFGISSFSHPDNALEVCGLLTPLHIVPEWFISFIFLSFSYFFSLDRCSISSREVSILWSYLDITLLFSSYVYLIFWEFIYKIIYFLSFSLFFFFNILVSLCIFLSFI